MAGLGFILTINFVFAVLGLGLHLEGVKKRDNKMRNAGIIFGAIAFLLTSFVAVFVMLHLASM